MTQDGQLADELEKGQGANGNAGRRLREAREAQNLTLEDVARHLKSNVRIIEALENEDSENLPQAIYVSGYIRSYSGLVSLPADEILNDFPNLDSPDPVIPKFKKESTTVKFTKSNIGKKSGSRLKIIFSVLLVLSIVAVSGLFYFKKTDVKEFVSDVVTEDLEIKQQPLRTVQPVEPSTETQAADSQVAQAPVEVVPQLEIPEPQVEESQPPAVIKTSRLLLEFSNESWVEVTDARGERLAYRLAKAPSRRLLEGVAPFKVFLGFAPGVVVNYNGLPYDLSQHTDGDVAQFRIGKDEDNVIWETQ